MTQNANSTIYLTLDYKNANPITLETFTASLEGLENIKQFIQPIAKDNGAQMNINLTDINNSTLIISFNSQEAKAMSYTADKYIEQLTKPTAQHYTNKALHWYLIKDDKEGDKAIIESINPKPVKTLFDNPQIKQKLLTEHDNPFAHNYIVDIQVETIENEPKLYIITNIREKL